MSARFGDFTAEEVPQGPLRDFYRLWQEKLHADGRLPARADFDPVTIPIHILPFVTLFDVVRSGGTGSEEDLQFRIRLVGTGIVEEIGQDTTGLFLADLPNSEQIVERAKWIVHNRKPVLVQNMVVSWTSQDYKHYSTLGAPLAADGVTVNMIFYLMTFW